MLSRIADALFWMNRYMERAGGLLRAVSTHYILSLDKDVYGSYSWRQVLETFSSATPEEITAMEFNTGAALKNLITDTTNNNSLKTIVGRARENARGVQDHITKEVWEEVNAIYHLMNQPSLDQRLNSYEAAEVMNLITRHTVLYTGVTDITMSRGPGWSFMNLGKYAERCLETIVLTNREYQRIQYNLDDVQDIMQWRYLLYSLSGYELHLKTYRSANYNYNVLHQVLFNDNFPHSVAHSLGRMERRLQEVIRSNPSSDNASLMRCFGRLISRVRYTDLETLNNDTLRQFLEEIRQELLHFNKRLGQQFFSYA
ncbi:alpha-E domain-containing protein [Chitinophaga japonensis]|uniref:Putative alpha-E superfamily protein n=1 Tax=Chitinophaga japonensis TaxID=104662 RepID=A0A562T8T4_CHIJA|nr:alpha-E domain-containing protein [Chitinophaga japonensis]TWI89336.1 putative alpha-E superfamily protein [Chitinophaga japonensis]